MACLRILPCNHMSGRNKYAAKESETPGWPRFELFCCQTSLGSSLSHLRHTSQTQHTVNPFLDSLSDRSWIILTGVLIIYSEIIHWPASHGLVAQNMFCFALVSFRISDSRKSLLRLESCRNVKKYETILWCGTMPSTLWMTLCVSVSVFNFH